MSAQDPRDAKDKRDVPQPPKPRKYRIRFLDTFPHGFALRLARVNLKEGDHLIVLKMTADKEAVVMVDEE